MRGRWRAVALAGLAALAMVAAVARRNTGKSSSGGGTGVLTLSGKIQPTHVVAIASPLAGSVDAILVATGESVAAGQVVARVNGARLVSRQAEARQREIENSEIVRELESAVDEARLVVSRAEAEAARATSVLAEAEREYSNQKSLYQEAATPLVTFEKSEREYQTARADRDSLDALARESRHSFQSLSRRLEEERAGRDRAAAEAGAPTVAEVRSPIAGTVISVGASVGEAVSLDTAPLMQIAGDMTSLEVAINADGPLLRALHPGQAATVDIAAGGGISAPGYVRAREPGGQFLVAFRSPSPEVRPGLPATVTIAETRQ